MEDHDSEVRGPSRRARARVDLPFDAAFCSDELIRAAKRLADHYGVGLTLHQANRPGTIKMYQDRYGMRPVEYLDKLGALGPNVLLAHVVDLDDREIDAIAHTDSKTVMCPSAALKMGSLMTRTARLPEMVARDIFVSLGTDAGNNSNLLETLRAMYLVTVLYKDARGSTDVCRPSWPSSWPRSTVRGPSAWSGRSAPSRWASGPTWCSSRRGAPSRARSSIPSTPWCTAPTGAACTRSSWTAGWSWRIIAPAS